MAADQLVRDYFDGIKTGHFREGLLSDDFRVWTIMGGWGERAAYEQSVAALPALFSVGPVFTITSLTVQDDRAVAEMTATGTFVDGTEYANDYVFVLTLRDGKVAQNREYFNVEKMRDGLLRVLLAQRSAATP